jgi:hypothetical protein
MIFHAVGDHVSVAGRNGNGYDLFAAGQERAGGREREENSGTKSKDEIFHFENLSIGIKECETRYGTYKYTLKTKGLQAGNVGFLKKRPENRFLFRPFVKNRNVFRIFQEMSLTNPGAKLY